MAQIDMVEHQVKMLIYSRGVWIRLIETGNIRGAIVEGGAWVSELRQFMERHNLDVVPERLAYRQFARDAVQSAIDNRKIRANDEDLWLEYITKIL